MSNLAGQIPGVTRTLFPAAEGADLSTRLCVGVCNTTPAVRNALRRVGIPFQVIARATPEAFGCGAFAWGSYYRKRRL
ncbi:MAG: thermostable hemolysin [Cellvibrionales bacterium]|nr:thermostable hemolysin [Cellvibrionales bacterium]